MTGQLRSRTSPACVGAGTGSQRRTGRARARWLAERLQVVGLLVASGCATADVDSSPPPAREAPTPSEPAPPPPAGADIDRIGRAVVRVVAFRGGDVVASGSGTLVEPTGLIYTNRHVVDDGDDYVIEMLEDPNELPVPRYRARVVGFSTEVDFAQLQIDRDERGRTIARSSIALPFLDATDPAEVQRGDRIYVLGYPGIGSGSLILTEGTVSGVLQGTVNSRRLPLWYQTDAQSSPGNSGGVAVSAAGKVVGIPTGGWPDERSGGRLGAILALGAVLEATGGGLETDPALLEPPGSGPTGMGGRLDWTDVPAFGSAVLSSGFAPDPYQLAVRGGGDVNADYVAGGCGGFAAARPSFRLRWRGSSQRLSFAFASGQRGDAALIVRLPDGSWACNDDYERRDPAVVLASPSSGQYDVWVASSAPNDRIWGFLLVTAHDPVDVLAQARGSVPSPRGSGSDAPAANSGLIVLLIVAAVTSCVMYFLWRRPRER